jgi:hypothetical protein
MFLREYSNNKWECRKVKISGYQNYKEKLKKCQGNRKFGCYIPSTVPPTITATATSTKPDFEMPANERNSPRQARFCVIIIT